MIVWLILFLLVIVISFLLAIRSMRDFQEIPQKSSLEYSLYLIRRPSNLTEALFQAIHQDLAKGGLIGSLERLFKKGQSALCIFGPKEILANYITHLELLELEDYTSSLNSKNTSVWEVGLKGGGADLSTNSFGNLPGLESHELFMWQVLFSGRLMQIRVGFSSGHPQRLKELSKTLQTLGEGKFIKLPRPFSVDSLLNFYKERSMDKLGGSQLSAKLLLGLLSIS